MSGIFVAIGLVLFIEGLIYGGFPGVIKRIMLQMQQMTEQSLRIYGIAAMIIGLLLIWLFH